MTKKIFKSIFVTTVIVLLATLVICSGVLYEYFSGIQARELDSELSLASQGVIAAGADYFTGLREKNCRLTWIDAEGNVLVDTEAKADAMGNHMDRREIQDAFQYGEGESTRYSETLMEKTSYLARKLPDGTVLRSATTQYSVIPLMLGMLQPIIFILILAIILAVILANRMAKKIVGPLNKLNLEKPLENDVYDELSPMLTHIEQQNRKIQAQIAKLKSNRDEFETITHNMHEGLVLLGANGKILSINHAAAKIFATNVDCVGMDFIAIDRSPETIAAIDDAKATGYKELHICHNGLEYQLNISRIGQGDGIVILAIDITDKVFAERNRREFTANVSHELKTPLQSILGRAELIANGVVKKSDIQGFASEIRAESERLVALINDIIRLSQLDEQHEMTFEPLDLLSLTHSVADELAALATQKNVQVEVVGTAAEVHTVPRLAHEIVYNIVENAIKYNRENGSVHISLTKTSDGILLTVSDTGIGIPKAHINRIFERFYRVDKSHSKETGGTGLGLSIVKHAAEYLGVKIALETTVGEGTSVFITFPCP